MPTSAKRQRKKENQRARQQAVLAAQRRARTRSRVTATAVVLVVVAGLIAVLAATGKKDKTTDTSTSTTVKSTATTVKAPAGATITGATPCPPTDGSVHATKFAQPPPTCIDPAKKYTAIFNTSEGVVKVALDTTKTPKTANNFVVLSRYRYYDGSRIFRTDTSIDIIQGGGPTTNSPSDPGPGYTIPDEGSGFHYSAGDLVMARTNAPNSAGGQFFFVAGPKASALDSQGTYVTFGKVTEGLDVVQKILGLNKDDPNSQLGGAPSRPVTIKSVQITAT